MLACRQAGKPGWCSMSQIRKNLELCLKRIEAAAARSGVSPSLITLVAVTKDAMPPLIYEAIDCGIQHIGEGKVQEALLKYKSIQDYLLKSNGVLIWHMVGHLQANKAKDAVKIFDLIHSVDSLHIAVEINKHAAKINKIQKVLLEVNTCGESTKFGFTPGVVIEAIKEMMSLKNIAVCGLMTIAPVVGDPKKAKPYFRKLKELRDEINCQLSAIGPQLDILSMGMTDDFQTAIEEGSNMVRIGRGIFGERKMNSNSQ